MRRGQKPSAHVRHLRTKKGIKKALVNPNIRKLSLKQVKAVKKAPMNADSDHDGVKNKYDRAPFDPRKK